ncbi:MAG: DUF4342 domain-containing protein [Clostridia bacterium]|nr:DUF4342 domain-containing protein [Clostridia bacterium]
MTQFEMTEKLSEKCNVTLEEAKTALETAGWNTLTATHLLEQERFRRMQALNEALAESEATAVQFAPEEADASAVATEDAATVEIASEISATAEAASESGASAEGAKAARRCRGWGLKNLADHLRRILAFGNRNRFIVRRDGEALLDMPVTALALLTLFAFWVSVPLLVIGLFTGCRYSFSGRELGRKDVNSALERAADAAGRARQSAAKA